MTIHIMPLPALKDNYIWMLTDKLSQTAWVVDPGEASMVLKILKKLQLTLTGILITHHHTDHCAGVSELCAHYPDVSVIQRPKINQSLTCLGEKCRILAIPGHTLDHVAYYIGKALFCGDTLFSGGCGKIFEGTPQQMVESLHTIMQLDDDTEIYCGHEYTLANLKFAITVDPDNSYLQAKLAMATTIAQNGGCTLPALLGEEKRYNPFLRCDVPTIIAAVEQYAGRKLDNPIEVFYQLREWKNKAIMA